MAKRDEKVRNIYRSLGRGMLLSTLTHLPVLLGAWIIFSSKGHLKSHILGLGFFLAGISGVIVIVRKESPMSIGSIRGKWAVIQGIIFTVLCWGFAFYFMFFSPE